MSEYARKVNSWARDAEGNAMVTSSSSFSPAINPHLSPAGLHLSPSGLSPAISPNISLSNSLSYSPASVATNSQDDLLNCRLNKVSQFQVQQCQS